MDSCNLVTMLLLDKGYFDYDYERVGILDKEQDWVETIRSEEEINKMVSSFGIGRQAKKPETEEEIQNYIINQGGK